MCTTFFLEWTNDVILLSLILSYPRRAHVVVMDSFHIYKPLT
jgi:hypothetical protein